MVSDGEELKSNNSSKFASEVEYSIFTETEDETGKQKGGAVVKPKSQTAEKKTLRAKNELQSISPYYNVIRKDNYLTITLSNACRVTLSKVR